MYLWQRKDWPRFRWAESAPGGTGLEMEMDALIQNAILVWIVRGEQPMQVVSGRISIGVATVTDSCG